MEIQNMMAGKSGIKFQNKVFINAATAATGKKEGEGPLGTKIDIICEDDLFGAKTFEEAESLMQKIALQTAIGKAGLTDSDIRFCISGDLLAQESATDFGVATMGIPLIGIYGACSTCGLGLSLGAMMISAGYADILATVTSSHFASAEKEFRFPQDYGQQRPLSSAWTVTGAGAYILGAQKGENCVAQITGVSIGKSVDFGIKDAQNMGACMAPAAADLIETHLNDFDAKPTDYDKIFTGDLGEVGTKALCDLLYEHGIDIKEQHMDCGLTIYNSETQDVGAGGSGCGCAAVTLSAYILEKFKESAYQKILFVPTGALLSKTTSNEGNTIPGIAHGVVIEKI